MLKPSLVKLAKPSIHIKKAMTLLEVMVMILVLSITLTAMFTTLMKGMNLQNLIQKRVQAQNIAREGIEWVVNLRNTNWLRFTSNRENCWKVQNYDAKCITEKPDDTNTSLKIKDGSYILKRQNGLWKLTSTGAFEDQKWNKSMKDYQIFIDEKGWYTSSGAGITEICNSFKRTECKTPFSREIKIKPLNDDNYLEVTAIVRWRDANPHKVTLKQTLSNWKSNYDNSGN